MRSAVGSLLSRITPSFVVFYLFCWVIFSYVLCYAWVTEDAYITFRVVDNFVHGYGLRWNVDERVQVYTHPLWMLIHIPFYALWGHIYLTTIVISAVLAVATVWVSMQYRPVSRFYIGALLLLPLASSLTFCHYIISGLEVPLSLFWLALFGRYFLESSQCLERPQRIDRLCFVASCAMLTRLDNGIILFPFVVWVIGFRLRQLRWQRLLLATSPLSAWCAFSLLYYGFVFPNTKYAKLDTGIPQQEYYQQGLHYLEEWECFDLFAVIWVCIACMCAGFAVMQYIAARKTEDANHEVAFYGAALIGIGLHMAYVIAVGGDFMAGRFFITPFFLSVLVIYSFVARIRIRHAQWVASAICIVCALGQLADPIPIAGGYADGYYGIADEWVHYIDNHLFYYSGIRSEPASGMVAIGKHATKDEWVVRNQYTIIYPIIGMYGYYAGSRVKIIDPLAITDPLLARLPVRNKRLGRIGHFSRRVPEGYIDSLKLGYVSRMEPGLADYFTKLRLVTTGPLFTWERIKTIVGFQLGWYDDERNAYIDQHP